MTTHTTVRLAQHQDHQPGHQSQMSPQPEIKNSAYKPSGKLNGKVALITGGDSGIGQAVAYLYSLEGAKVAISYLDETEDAENTRQMLQDVGEAPLLLPGDIQNSAHCQQLIEKTVDRFGQLDILVCIAVPGINRSSSSAALLCFSGPHAPLSALTALRCSRLTYEAPD
jgi:NAD(P)-dependent dehydrogenase (short-subunit alcohol dehydrogenase family)